jgi:hypothetical protein
MPDGEKHSGFNIVGVALKRAGWLSREDRLMEMMIKVITECGMGRPDLIYPKFEYELLATKDVELVWEFFMPAHRSGAISLWLTRAKESMKLQVATERAEAERKKAEAEKAKHKKAKAEEAAKAAEETAMERLPQGPLAAAAPSAAPVAGPNAAPSVPQGQQQAATGPKQLPSLGKPEGQELVMQRSILQTFMVRIDGRRIALGEVTGRQLREWIRNHRRNGRFAELLDERVLIPDDVKIKGIVPLEIAEQCYAEATKMEFAA